MNNRKSTRGRPFHYKEEARIKAFVITQKAGTDGWRENNYKKAVIVEQGWKGQNKQADYDERLKIAYKAAIDEANKQEFPTTILEVYSISSNKIFTWQ